MKFTFMRPEFFDIFGVGIFALITIMSVRTLFFDTSFPYWMIIFLLIIGLLGLVVDGIIVYKTYISKNRKV